jgi:hypothetical protein
MQRLRRMNVARPRFAVVQVMKGATRVETAKFV